MTKNNYLEYNTARKTAINRELFRVCGGENKSLNWESHLESEEKREKMNEM